MSRIKYIAPQSRTDEAAFVKQLQNPWEDAQEYFNNWAERSQKDKALALEEALRSRQLDINELGAMATAEVQGANVDKIRQQIAQDAAINPFKAEQAGIETDQMRLEHELDKTYRGGEREAGIGSTVATTDSVRSGTKRAEETHQFGKDDRVKAEEEAEHAKYIAGRAGAIDLFDANVSRYVPPEDTLTLFEATRC